MLDTPPCMISEPEGYVFPVNLQGAGASVPTRLKGRNNYSLTRTSAGLLLMKFNDDPGPTFLGILGFCFGDATPTVVFGWSLVAGAYTAPSGGGSTPASLVLNIGNGSNAAADLASTSTLSFALGFKRISTGD